MVDFYRAFKKIPGGMLLLPMLVTALINTVFPEALSAVGGLTSALFKGGSLTFASYLLFVSGATTSLKTIGTVLRRSGSLMAVRLLISFGCGFLFLRLFGLSGVAGINAVAFVTCICSSAPAIFMAIVQDYGDREDMASFAACALLGVPAFPLLILSVSQGGGFDFIEILSVLIPFLLGLLMGNLDPKLARMFGAATPLALPFLGFCFGSSINLIAAARAGLSGVLLAVVVLCIQVPLTLLTDRLLNRRPGYCGVAMCATGGTALILPSLLVGREAFAPYLETAMAQIALCLLITNLTLPFIAKAVAARWGAPRALAQAELPEGQAAPGEPV